MARPASNTQDPFGALLSRIRKEKGLTQMQLAERLKTSQQMVDYYERRAGNPTAKTIQKIAKALDIPLSQLTTQETISMKVKPGPQSKLEELIQRLSTLPRGKQKVVIDMLEGVLDKAS